MDPERPFITAIDGVPIEKWVEASAAIVPRSAPHFTRWHAIRGLRSLSWLRSELGLPEAPVVRVEPAAAGDTGRRTVELPVAETRPIYGDWPRVERAQAILDGGIGYVRIADMDGDPERVAQVVQSVEGLRGTRGLIIDVRGNGGGSRDLLLALFPLFMRPEDPPHVANVAAVRLESGEPRSRPEGYLEDRFLPGSDPETGSSASTACS